LLQAELSLARLFLQLACPAQQAEPLRKLAPPLWAHVLRALPAGLLQRLPQIAVQPQRGSLSQNLVLHLQCLAPLDLFLLLWRLWDLLRAAHASLALFRLKGAQQHARPRQEELTWLKVAL
jgi:hypothetical protein